MGEEIERFKVDDVVGPGSVFLLSPADFHEIQSTSATPVTCYNVVLDPHVVERQLDELVPSGSDWVPWTASGLPEVEADFERLWREAQTSAPSAR